MFAPSADWMLRGGELILDCATWLARFPADQSAKGFDNRNVSRCCGGSSTSLFPLACNRFPPFALESLATFCGETLSPLLLAIPCSALNLGGRPLMKMLELSARTGFPSTVRLDNVSLRKPGDWGYSDRFAVTTRPVTAVPGANTVSPFTMIG